MSKKMTKNNGTTMTVAQAKSKNAKVTKFGVGTGGSKGGSPGPIFTGMGKKKGSKKSAK